MCSYCGCQAITVIGRYMAEHEVIINLAGDVRRAVASGDASAVRRTTGVLRQVLLPHTGSEEQSLFAQMRQDPEFTEHIDSLCAEHTDIGGMLDRIEAGDHDGFHPFEILLRRHIDREDNGLFPAAAIALGGPEWDWVAEHA
jgi:hemerythrin-like domain-containing protein